MGSSRSSCSAVWLCSRLAWRSSTCSSRGAAAGRTRRSAWYAATASTRSVPARRRITRRRAGCCRWTFTIAGTSGGTSFTAFEYRWTTGSGKSSRSHRIGALLWTLQRSLPQFFLAPEGWWDKLAAYFGGQDIDFDDSPAFSRSYRLRGADEGAVRALF